MSKLKLARAYYDDLWRLNPVTDVWYVTNMGPDEYAHCLGLAKHQWYVREGQHAQAVRRREGRST
ncbi:MAG: hypothetical protein SFV32_12560 [Opitutaceae bacterium]|nr:hypothetical protein [Opitutaceae bacterium]